MVVSGLGEEKRGNPRLPYRTAVSLDLPQPGNGGTQATVPVLWRSVSRLPWLGTPGCLDANDEPNRGMMRKFDRIGGYSRE